MGPVSIARFQKKFIGGISRDSDVLETSGFFVLTDLGKDYSVSKKIKNFYPFCLLRFELAPEKFVNFSHIPKGNFSKNV